VITLERVSVCYGSGARQINAASDVTLSVAEGEAFGLVGESGSGKSTVLRAIAGLIPHASGRVVLDSQEMQKRRTKAERKMVQMVFQDPYGSLHPNQTVDQTLSMPVAIHALGNADRRVAAALQEVGLGREHRYRYPHQLSGGQRQRVAIARALILEPRILLLDEPTSALDPISSAKLEETVTQLKADHTIVIVTHNLGQAARVSDYTGFMYLGELVEFGPTDEVFTRPATQRTSDYITGRFG